MKPYGRNGKLEVAKCGCCSSHGNDHDQFKCITEKNLLRRRDRKKARQLSNKMILSVCSAVWSA